MSKIFNILIFVFLYVTVVNTQEVPRDWFFGNPEDEFIGIGVNKCYESINTIEKGKPVIVAIIDSGIDFDHEDLAENMWVNPGEIAGNGKDDDGNGYMDDIHGWNFIGGPDGSNVGQDSYEAARVYGMYRYKYENADVKKLTKSQKSEYEIFVKAKENVEKETNKAKNKLNQINTIETKVKDAFERMDNKLGNNQLTKTWLDSLDTSSDEKLTLAKNIINQYLTNSDEKDYNKIKTTVFEDIDSDKVNYQNKIDYSYNPDFDPRATIVKDNYKDVSEKYYGNNNVEGPDATHGTHVGGIVGAIRGNNKGAEGIANNVKLMSVRAVPDGDERDKDVANAIIYAVDNGAQIINMSFGKGFSTHKSVVDEAVKYAAKNDVLLIHAAGNSAQDNDKITNYPNANYEKKVGFIFKKKKRAQNWIEVGALNVKKGPDMVAPFSNYGKKEVDVFAPGMRVYAPVPGNNYAPLQGTSMASPVVAAIAALIRSQYPSLTAEQVKEAIMNSVTPIQEEVTIPGSKTEKTKFSNLCVSGGIVNVYNALTYASKMKGKKKRSKGNV
ncbi:MAG: S8 family serine peptidase [Saprospiraceae bacterium]|nr:S8 family serine peptidase [Saprospiraceae bacterium]MBK8548238.1 S8 family serine peptidase [Saprospiraceae bacterium]MBK8819201.1 S8 family serine peptidase [Saprospiraceae bacterium]MBK9043376.1 S8 family serine peptidase [Saprospiraceae bacterium]MBP6695691.1 S8 family serine peptidase [Saprospiraceae bacterium]